MKFDLIFSVKIGKEKFYRLKLPVNLIDSLSKASGLSNSELKRLEKSKSIDIWLTTSKNDPGELLMK